VAGIYQPFFSVIIPTKNRADLASHAVQSVLHQTFRDFEVIVSDNDDTDATHQAISEYRDHRIRYHRASGSLSMPDNWERGFTLAAGRYVLILTDRCVLMSYALERLYAAINHYGEDVYVYNYQHIDSLTVEGIRPLSPQRAPMVVQSKWVFNYFLHQFGWEGSLYLPRGLNSCCSNTLLQDLCASAIGRVCPPVSPDYTFAFLSLAYRSRVVVLNERLFLWGSHSLSNGLDYIRGGSTSTRFLRDLSLSDDDLVSDVPIKAATTFNSICNDLVRLKKLLPREFSCVRIDLYYYFIFIHMELTRVFSAHDPSFSLKMGAWERALADQSPHLQSRVLRCIESGYDGLPLGAPVSRVTKSIRHRAKRLVSSWIGPDRLARLRRRLGNVGTPTARQDDRLNGSTNFRNMLDLLSWIERCETPV